MSSTSFLCKKIWHKAENYILKHQGRPKEAAVADTEVGHVAEALDRQRYISKVNFL